MMSYANAYNIEDLARLAQQRLPQVAWDYLERGAEDDVTMVANRRGFERIYFRPRTLVDVSQRTLRHELFGRTYSAPFGIAPTGAAGLYCFDADVALARAAGDAGVPRFQNVDSNVGGRIIAKDLSAFRARRDALDWSDIAWLRTIWPRKLLLKGILAAEDARLALEHGVDGVVVSNHGDRQLDGAVAAIDVLPAIVAAVGGSMPVLFDSGVRRGSDIVKALALGADFVFFGRATLYGAAAGGMDGVAHALNLLRAETDRVMALIGCSSVAALDRSFLEMPDAA